MSKTPSHVVLALAALMIGAPALAQDAKASGGDVIGPVAFRCDDGSEILATFDNAPDPATALVVRGDQREVLEQARSGSGARYVGADVSFWNKGRDAAVEWHGQKLECATAE